MTKAITRFSERYPDNWVEVGDTVNGKRITEIWSSSVGSPIFIIGGKHHTWKEFLEILPEADNAQLII